MSPLMALATWRSVEASAVIRPAPSTFAAWVVVKVSCVSLAVRATPAAVASIRTWLSAGLVVVRGVMAAARARAAAREARSIVRSIQVSRG